MKHHQPPARPRRHVDIAADRVAKIYAQAIIDAADAAGCRREVTRELAMLARERAAAGARGGGGVLVAEGLGRGEGPHHRQARRRSADRPPTHQRPSRARPARPARHARRRRRRRGAAGRRARRPAAGHVHHRHAARRRRAGPDRAPTPRRPCRPRSRRRSSSIPTIIGGLVVRVGDTIYDQSVATGLARIGGRLQQRNIHAIQNGEYSWHS